MAGAGGDPDVEPEADSQGKVARRAAASARAVQVAAPQPQRPRNFFRATLRGKTPASTAASSAAAQPEAAHNHKMNIRSESLRQLALAARLMTGQPLHFYDRQGEKDFGSLFTQSRQQARSERGKTRDPRGFARRWPT